jgi:hypothetical protein
MTGDTLIRKAHGMTLGLGIGECTRGNPLSFLNFDFILFSMLHKMLAILGYYHKQ